MIPETDDDRLNLILDFGEECTFSPGNVWPNRSSGAAPVWIIFDAEYLEIVGERQSVNSTNTFCAGRTKDLAGAVRGSVINRLWNGQDFKIANVEPDGTGWTILELEGPR